MVSAWNDIYQREYQMLVNLNLTCLLSLVNNLNWRLVLKNTDIWEKIYLAVGRWRFSSLKALFKDPGSRLTRSFLFGFSTTTSPSTQSVGFWTGSVICKSTIHFNSFSNVGFKARGIFLTRVKQGLHYPWHQYGEYFWEFLFLQNNQKTQTKIVHHLRLWQSIFQVREF